VVDERKMLIDRLGPLLQFRAGFRPVQGIAIPLSHDNAT
jgi:hypothetical protein